MDVKFLREGNTLVAMIDGEIDHHTATKARDRIDTRFIMEPVKNMILDLSHVTFMDSAGIGLIMGRMNRVKSVGGKMTIRKPRPEVAKILKMSRMESFIDMEAR